MYPDDKPQLIEGDLFSEPMVSLAGLSRKTSKTRLLSPITSVDGSCHSVHSHSNNKRLMSPDEKRPTSKERKLYNDRGSFVDRLYNDTKSNLKNMQRLSQVKIPVKKKNIGFNNIHNLNNQSKGLTKNMSNGNLNVINSRSVGKGSFVDNDCDRPSTGSNSAAKPRQLFMNERVNNNVVKKKERTLSPNNDEKAHAKNN